MTDKGPGLPSLRAARARRDRSDTVRRPLGFSPMVSQAKETPWRARLVVLALAAIIAVLYFVVNRGGVSQEKEKLLAEHRAAVTTIGEEWRPLRDRIEHAVLELAGPWPGELVAKDLAEHDFRKRPGLYLRLVLDDARDTPSLRRAAKDSLRDGFASCLLRPGASTPSAAEALGLPPGGGPVRDDDAGLADAGDEAGADASAAPGELPPSDEQLWNLREAYKSARVLSEEWSAEVRGATEGLRLRIFKEQLDQAVKGELPKAARIVRRAEHLLVVLDEPVDAGRTEDGGAPTAESLQRVTHPARVAVVDLRTGETRLRIRRDAGGTFLVAGGRLSDPALADAVKRQVNNCALAEEVRQAAFGN